MEAARSRSSWKTRPLVTMVSVTCGPAERQEALETSRNNANDEERQETSLAEKANVKFRSMPSWMITRISRLDATQREYAVNAHYIYDYAVVITDVITMYARGSRVDFSHPGNRYLAPLPLYVRASIRTINERDHFISGPGRFQLIPASSGIFDRISFDGRFVEIQYVPKSQL